MKSQQKNGGFKCKEKKSHRYQKKQVDTWENPTQLVNGSEGLASFTKRRIPVLLPFPFLLLLSLPSNETFSLNWLKTADGDWTPGVLP